MNLTKKHRQELAWWRGSGTRFYDRHEQLQVLFYNTGPLAALPPEEYWQIVGEVWKRTEFPHHQYQAWYEIFAETPGQNAYTRQWLQSPQRVYRGIDAAYSRCDCDWSWTTDRDQAEWFSKRFGCGQPVVLEFDCALDPDRVLCVFEDDTENEVLLWSPRVVDMVNCPEDFLEAA